ncbi:cupredoxin domain-containing protein [Deinococcus radiotolerans]|uniref:EfeO-type cupredoxin-like domain-containing protein n=1 Tax=Deinococcus radiotolerans TaxID=1309407 RepID=A0ABQ2FMV9_9DEIO|nr:cupredoxin domain-containing protein [Deinococcus radiotolerans]GGL07119.1 hypothetical protein GCM10010844_27370 [Deinococcus radiotolerans]
MKHLTLLAILASTSLVHAAGTQAVTVRMSEMMFMPMNLSLKAGQKVTITLKNTGKADHEFQLYAKPRTLPRGENAWDAYMEKNSIWLASRDTALKIAGKAVTGKFIEVALKPGQSATLSFTPAHAGTFEMACHEPGHYEGGMKGTVTVK